MTIIDETLLSEQEEILLFALTCALSALSQGMWFHTDAACDRYAEQIWPMHDRQAQLPKETLPQQIRFRLFFPFLYQRSRTLLETRAFPAWLTLSPAPPDHSIEEQGAAMEQVAKKLIGSDFFLERYQIPLAVYGADDEAVLAMHIGISLVLMDYPHRLKGGSELEQSIQRLTRIIHGQLISVGLPPLDAQAKSRFQQTLRAFYPVLTEVLWAHPGAAEHLASLLNTPDQLTGRLQALQWLMNQVDTWRDPPAHLLRGGNFLALPTIDVRPYLDRPISPSCVEPQCQARSYPAVLLRFPGNNACKRVTLLACEQHRLALIWACTGMRLLRLASQWRVMHQQTLLQLPTVKILADPTRGLPSRFSSVIERFRLWQRTERMQPVREGLTALAGEKGELFGNATCDAFVDLAAKWYLDETAVAVARCLPLVTPDAAIERAISRGPTWMKLQSPLPTRYGTMHAIAFGQLGEAAIQYAERQVPLSEPVRKRLRAALAETINTTIWELVVCREDGLPIFVLVFREGKSPDGTTKRTWTLPEQFRVCGAVTCGRDGKLCQACMCAVEGYLGLYTNLLRLLSGEIRTQEEAPAATETTERVRRKEPDPLKPHKFREKEVTHRYTMVTFNAALQKKRPSAPSTQAGLRTGRAWYADLDPEALIYGPIPVSPHSRHLKSPRYRNSILSQGGDPDHPEGFPVKVREHPRQVVQKISRLRKVKHLIFEV